MEAAGAVCHENRRHPLSCSRPSERKGGGGGGKMRARVGNLKLYKSNRQSPKSGDVDSVRGDAFRCGDWKRFPAPCDTVPEGVGDGSGQGVLLLSLATLTFSDETEHTLVITSYFLYIVVPKSDVPVSVARPAIIRLSSGWNLLF